MKTKLTSQLKKRQQSLYEAFRWLKINSVHDVEAKKKRQNVVSIKMWLDLAESIRSGRKKIVRRAAEIMFVVAKANDRNDPTQKLFENEDELNSEIQKCHQNDQNGCLFNGFQILAFFLNLHVSPKKQRRDQQRLEEEQQEELNPLFGPLDVEHLLPKSVRELRLRCSRLEKSLLFNRSFDFLSFISILLSVGSIMSDDDARDEDPSCSLALIIVSVLFSVMFTLEVMIKVLGLGVAGYFHSSLNILDCIATFGYWIVLGITSGKFCGSNVIYLFVLRTVRLLRILYVSKSQRRNLESAAAVFRVLLTRYSLIVGSHIFERDSLTYLTH